MVHTQLWIPLHNIMHTPRGVVPSEQILQEGDYKTQAQIPKWIQKCLWGNQLWIDSVRVTQWAFCWHTETARRGVTGLCKSLTGQTRWNNAAHNGLWYLVWQIWKCYCGLLSQAITKLACGFFGEHRLCSCDSTGVEEACLCFKGFGWEGDLVGSCTPSRPHCWCVWWLIPPASVSDNMSSYLHVLIPTLVVFHKSGSKML